MPRPVAAIGALFYVVSFAVCGQAQPDESQQREAVCDEARIAFQTKDFATLEATSRAYRSQESRTPSGIWKLSLFYCGIARSIDAELGNGIAGRQDISTTLDQWESEYPSSPSAHIARSMSLISDAWSIRGYSFASEVKAEAWKPFDEGIEAARTNLEKYKSLSSEDPQWYVEMIDVAKAQSWDRPRFDALMDEGLDKQPLFYETYFGALSYLLPKWNGDLGEVEGFARAAVARTSKEEGQAMYARIYWNAAQAEFKFDLFANSLADWSLMKKGFDDMIAAYPDNWNLNNFAKFACLAGDKETTTRLLGQIPGEAPSAWSYGVSYSSCLDWTKGLRPTGRLTYVSVPGGSPAEDPR